MSLNPPTGGNQLSQEQVSAVNDYINTDYIRATSDQIQNINTSDSVVVLGSALEGNGITLNQVDNSITFTKTRLYEFSLLINAATAGAFALDIELWAESFDGQNWNPFTTSGQRLGFSTFANSKKIDITSVLTIPAGTIFRFQARTTAGIATLGGEPFTVNGVTVNVLASVLAVTSVGPEQ